MYVLCMDVPYAIRSYLHIICEHRYTYVHSLYFTIGYINICIYIIYTDTLSNSRYAIDPGTGASFTRPKLTYPPKSIVTHPFDKELKRRKLYLYFNLLRSPVFEHATLPIFKLLTIPLGYIPIINTLPRTIISALTYINNSHFRSSASS